MKQEYRQQYLDMIPRVFVRALRDSVSINPAEVEFSLSEGEATSLLIERESRSDHLRKAESDREHLLNIICSLPDHQTSSSAMAAAYWNWLQTMRPAITSARALQASLSAAKKQD